MFNESINYSNYLIDVSSVSDCGMVEVPFNLIISHCTQWENYSTNSHYTYIWVIGIYYISKIIKKYIWNPSFTYKWKGIKGNLNEEYTLYWFEELMDMSRMFLFFRIIQVWWVMQFILK